MADNIKEMVSALLDGEASEIEVHKVLRHLGSDEKLKSSFVAWQQVRAAARKDLVLSGQGHLALHQRISEVIGAEVHIEGDDSDFSKSRYARYMKPVAGMALAASIMVAITLGIQLQSGSGDSNGIDVAVDQTSPGIPAADSSFPTPQQAITPQYVSSNNSSSNVDADELVELDEDKQKMVREYLLQHERMTQLNPNVRVVTFDKPDKN